MRGTLAGKTLAEEKIAAFEQLQAEFAASFHFVQGVQGQRRFDVFPAAETVHYLHALWVCARKDGLLSVSKGGGRYEGRICLELLRGWQEGDTAAVLAFLQHKLDGLPFADLTRQIQDATTARPVDVSLVQFLTYGRQLLLNRGMNLMRAMDAIFALPEDALMQEVRSACRQSGHGLDQIKQQLVEIEAPLFSIISHPLLAQRNMQVMNMVGVQTLPHPTELPESRFWSVIMPADPQRPFAEHIIEPYMEIAIS